jgi:hypothetical protein
MLVIIEDSEEIFKAQVNKPLLTSGPNSDAILNTLYRKYWFVGYWGKRFEIEIKSPPVRELVYFSTGSGSQTTE